MLPWSNPLGLLTTGFQNRDIVHRELTWLLDAARREDIKAYDVPIDSNYAPGPSSSSRSQATSHQRNRLTAAIAVDGGAAAHVVKVQLEPIRRRAARGPIHGEDVRRNYGEMDQLGGQYSPTWSFLAVIDAHTKKVAGSPDNHPMAVVADPTPTGLQSDSDSLNRANPTVESIADAQQFDGSFSINDGFIRLLTGSSSMPSLPNTLTALPGSREKKQTIWITVLALAVFAKNLPEDEVSWKMLAEKAESFVRASLASMGVDDTDVNAMVSQLKRAAARFVAYKFWFPILRRSDSSVVILVVSIDG